MQRVPITFLLSEQQTALQSTAKYECDQKQSSARQELERRNETGCSQFLQRAEQQGHTSMIKKKIRLQD